MEAAFRFAKHAVEKIDLRVHEGEHPRMGAVDVIPFVPIRDMDMAECVERSKVLGKRIADELELPVFLYEESASAPHRKNLAAIRKGQFEGMAAKVLEDQWHPCPISVYGVADPLRHRKADADRFVPALNVNEREQRKALRTPARVGIAKLLMPFQRKGSIHRIRVPL